MEKDLNIDKSAPSPGNTRRVIRLDDLDGDEMVLGGAGEKLLFGEQPESTSPFAGLFGPGGQGAPPSTPRR